MIDVKLEQLPNAAFPIEATEFPIVIEVKFVQCANAFAPIEVTELGMLTEVKPIQPINAAIPIEVTEFGIVMLVKHEPPNIGGDSGLPFSSNITLLITLLSINSISTSYSPLDSKEYVLSNNTLSPFTFNDLTLDVSAIASLLSSVAK